MIARRELLKRKMFAKRSKMRKNTYPIKNLINPKNDKRIARMTY